MKTSKMNCILVCDKKDDTRRRPVFNKTRVGTPFSLDRNNFREGTYVNNQFANNIHPNKRAGLGNLDITRNNFISPAVKARQVLDFDKLQLLDIEESGIKVQLSEKNISQLIGIKIPDPLDTKWLDEKARLERYYAARGFTTEQIKMELEFNKPLGREQRTTSTTSNFGQANLSIGQQLNDINRLVNEGKAESDTQRRAVFSQLARLLSKTAEVEKLTNQQMNTLANTLTRISPAQTFKDLALDKRLVDEDYYGQNTGVINLLILSHVMKDPSFNTPGGVSFNTPVRSYQNDGTVNYIKLASMERSLRHSIGRKFLDLEKVGLITKEMLKYEVGLLKDDYDNPLVSIDINNRP